MGWRARSSLAVLELEESERIYSGWLTASIRCPFSGDRKRPARSDKPIFAAGSPKAEFGCRPDGLKLCAHMITASVAAVLIGRPPIFSMPSRYRCPYLEMSGCNFLLFGCHPGTMIRICFHPQELEVAHLIDFQPPYLLKAR